MVEDRAGGRRGHDKEKERKWRGMLREFGRDTQSVRGFCRERGLKEAAFYWWRREIGRRDREAEEPRSKALPAEASVLAPVVMVEEVCREKKEESERLAAIEIVLRGGTMVRVANGTTREQLGMVLDALERSRC
jgi:hypothetical protein